MRTKSGMLLNPEAQAFQLPSSSVSAKTPPVTKGAGGGEKYAPILVPNDDDGSPEAPPSMINGSDASLITNGAKEERVPSINGDYTTSVHDRENTMDRENIHQNSVKQKSSSLNTTEASIDVNNVNGLVNISNGARPRINGNSKQTVIPRPAVSLFSRKNRGLIAGNTNDDKDSSLAANNGHSKEAVVANDCDVASATSLSDQARAETNGARPKNFVLSEATGVSVTEQYNDNSLSDSHLECHNVAPQPLPYSPLGPIGFNPHMVGGVGPPSLTPYGAFSHPPPPPQQYPSWQGNPYHHTVPPVYENYAMNEQSNLDPKG